MSLESYSGVLTMGTAYSLDLSTLAREYASGALTPVGVVDDVYAAIAATGERPTWIHIVPHMQAHERAVELERQRAAGAALPLYGVPFAIKDNIDIAELPTTAGCPEFTYVAQATAGCVGRLLDAGAILVGKTNLDQFATGLTGTRSPYGECRNAFDPRYISGGSSSGSAVAVASGLVSFSLGTDTAGSGRVPAGCNNIVGLKPTRGLIGLSGVVPACRSLDCISIFALTCEDARTVFNAAQGHDAGDPWSRTTLSSAVPAPAPGDRWRFGIPRVPEFFGDVAASEHYEHALALLERTGAAIVAVDYAPFAEAARLLYEGPWLAERLSSVKDFMRAHPRALLPVTREIIERGERYSAVDAFEAAHALQRLKQRCDEVFRGIDALVVPTTPTTYTLQQIAAAPLELNARLGFYTNFVNLLDYCALAAPAGLRRDGLPAGVTFVGPAFGEAALLACADGLQRAVGGRLGATRHPLPPVRTSPTAPSTSVVLAVVGAHLSGLPLNHELTARGGRLIGPALTASAYRLYELPGGNVRRPGLVRTDNGHGAAIDVELWAMAAAEFGAFVAAVPAPLGIGSVALSDGREVKGFLCEQYAVANARDISEFGGWRKFLAAGGKGPDGHAG